jgi:hypothetical protein
LIFEAEFIANPELTVINQPSLLWTANQVDGVGEIDLVSIGETNYMPAGGVHTSITWLFSMTKIEADSVSRIESMSSGILSTSHYQSIDGVGIIPLDTIGDYLVGIYGNDYAFELGSYTGVNTFVDVPIMSEAEVDLRMNWDVFLDPMILYSGGWIPVTTGILQRFYVDITVLSADTISTFDDPKPPVVSGPETFGMTVGEEMNVIFSASSINPSIYSVYTQDYFEDQEFDLDISDNTFTETNVWDGGDISIGVSTLAAGRHVITVVVEDLSGMTAQHSTFILVADVDAEHITDGYTVSDRTAPSGDNIADSVVSGFIPRPRSSSLDILMDNKLIVGVVIVVIVIVGGIGFTILTKKPKKARKTKKKR